MLSMHIRVFSYSQGTEWGGGGGGRRIIWGLLKFLIILGGASNS